jgi:hypothetical protein
VAGGRTTLNVHRGDFSIPKLAIWGVTETTPWQVMSSHLHYKDLFSKKKKREKEKITCFSLLPS